jgi:AraC-like DNA-binding protein
MQRFSDNLSRVVHYANPPERICFSIRTEPEAGHRIISGGSELRHSDIVRRGRGSTFFQRSEGPTSYGSMSLPVDELATIGAAVAGCDLTPKADSVAVTPSPDAITTLRRLYASACTLAELSPAVIAAPEAARSLEQALIQAMLECLSASDGQEDRTALRQHAAIMRRFHRVVEERLDEPLYIPELCREVGTSQRTLNACCHEHLGMGPKRFLLLRRMHMVRRALRESNPSGTTVTEIATQYGFWQLGRLAGEYKVLFGESPFATLARPP